MGLLIAVLQACVFLLTVAIAAMDWRFRRIPNALVVPTAMVTGLVSVLVSAISLLIAVLWWIVFSVAYQYSRPSNAFEFGKRGVLGGGDVKLAFVVGGISSWVWGWGSIIALGVTGLGSVAIIGIFRRRAVPMAPAMIGGAWAAYWVGRLVVFTY